MTCNKYGDSVKKVLHHAAVNNKRYVDDPKALLRIPSVSMNVSGGRRMGEVPF